MEKILELNGIRKNFGKKEILKGMMTRRNDAIETAHSRESFLFYKNGFLDGMGFLLNAVRYM